MLLLRKSSEKSNGDNDPDVDGFTSIDGAGPSLDASAGGFI